MANQVPHKAHGGTAATPGAKGERLARGGPGDTWCRLGREAIQKERQGKPRRLTGLARAGSEWITLTDCGFSYIVCVTVCVCVGDFMQM